jgi:hypothetical protein
MALISPEEGEMSSVRKLDTDKLRARRIIATATFTAVTVAFLLVIVRSAPVSARPPAPRPSNEAADKQVPSNPREAEQTTAVGIPMELEPLALFQTPLELEPLALFQTPDDPPADQVPARLEPSPAANPSPKGSEQRLFKSRRALETLDPREFLRHATVPK